MRETVEALDLPAILDTYDSSRGGHPAYHPRMMTELLAYGCCVGVRSSRKIERATPDPSGADISPALRRRARVGPPARAPR